MDRSGDGSSSDWNAWRRKGRNWRIDSPRSNDGIMRTARLGLMPGAWSFGPPKVIIRTDMPITRTIYAVCLAALLTLSLSGPAMAADDAQSCGIYFTGVGCPHCAKTDPVVLGQMLRTRPDLTVIEYEVYQSPGNARFALVYDERYGTGLKIPLLIFDESHHLSGDLDILREADQVFDILGPNGCLLPTGESVGPSSLDIRSLPGQPKIWHGERILIGSGGDGPDSETLRRLLYDDDLSGVLNGLVHEPMAPLPVPLSGGSVTFEHATRVGSWLLQWNGAGPEPAAVGVGQETAGGSLGGPTEPVGSDTAAGQLTVPKILSLAAVDAINPCAIAVLSLMLIAILAYNPRRRSRVLLAGLAFVASVFLMYLAYGLVIVKSFHLIQALTGVRLWLYRFLGGLAVLFGILNIRDYIRYRPGAFLTEMPMFLRPKVKKVISGVTSPSGAFTVGLFVTLFLLPCTIGPYVIAGGILSALELLQTLPFLLLYNAVFVLPMVAITLLVYWGLTRVQDVTEWKDRNIRRLHLAAGVIIMLLGVAMLAGLV